MNNITAALVLVTVAAASAASAGDLHVEIKGIKSAQGKVVVSLYKNSDTFLKQALQTVGVAVNGDATAVTFANLAPGDYAIAAYHDVNANGKLDTNFIGIPSEPTGASNNAKQKFGPPKYEDAKFTVGEAAMTVGFVLHN